jgi:ClpP class serine protease
MWLLADPIRRQIDSARPGQAQLAFDGRVISSAGARPLYVAGSVAEIRIEGVLTKGTDLIVRALGFSNTSYRDLEAALVQAATDPAVHSVVLFVDSPGGTVDDGLFATVAALERLHATKPVRVRAANALAAAYVLAAVGGPIEASSVGAMFGSIGLAASYLFDSDTEIVDVTNTDSPNKRPNVKRPEGRAVVVRELDTMHELIVGAIARGRGVDTTVVRDNYGRGATVLARDAKARGMIDKVNEPRDRSGPISSARSNALNVHAMTEGTQVMNATNEQLAAQLGLDAAQHANDPSLALALDVIRARQASGGNSSTPSSSEVPGTAPQRDATGPLTMQARAALAELATMRAQQPAPQPQHRSSPFDFRTPEQLALADEVAKRLMGVRGTTRQGSR